MFGTKLRCGNCNRCFDRCICHSARGLDVGLAAMLDRKADQQEADEKVIEDCMDEADRFVEQMYPS